MFRSLLSIGLLTFSAMQVFGAVDPTLLGLVPQNTKVLVGINAQNAANSSLGQALLTTQGIDQKVQGLTQQAGFDLRHDLQYVLVSSAGGSNTNPNVVIMRGSFDVGRLSTAAKAKDAKTETYAGSTVIEFSDGSVTSAIAFPQDGIAVAGPLPLVKGVLDVRSTPTTLDPALLHLVSQVSSDDIWFASTEGMSSLPKGMLRLGDQHANSPLSQANLMQSIVQESGGVLLGGQVQLSFDAVTRSPQDANSLADVLRFVSNRVQTRAASGSQEAMLVAALFQNLQVGTNASDVQIQTSVPETLFEQMLSQHSAGGGATLSAPPAAVR